MTADHVILTIPFAVLRTLDYSGAKLRLAEEDGDHAARRRQERQAPAPVQDALVERARVERQPLQRPRAPERLGRHARAERRNRDHRRLLGRQRLGGAQAVDAVLEHRQQLAGRDVRERDARPSRDALPGHLEAVEREGVAVDAVPRSEPEPRVLVLEARAVRRLLRLRGCRAGQHPLRRRALLAGLPGLHGRRRSGGRPRGGRGAGRVQEVAGPSRGRLAVTCSGVIRTFRRVSSGFRHGYSSLPRYFFASLSICGSAPSVVSSARPSIAIHLWSSFGSTTISASARVVLEVLRLRAAERRVERGGAVLDVDPDDGVVRRAVLAERRRDADEGLLEELRAASRSALPCGFLLVGRVVGDNGGRPRSLPGFQFPHTVADLGDMRLKLAALVLLVCGVAFVMHERKSALERHLGVGGDPARRPARPRALPELRGQPRRRHRGGGDGQVRPVGDPVRLPPT